MPEGIIATVDNGFATLDFVDRDLRGPALAELISIGGPESVETLSRSGPRRQYRVPEGNAREAGLLDDEVPGAVYSAGHDTGAAAATQASDPNVNPGLDGADWHTPVAEYTSANSFVADAREGVLTRPQVVTGDGGSFGGSGSSLPHAEVIEHVAENTPAPTPGSAVPETPAAVIANALGGQPSALPSDPGGNAPQPTEPVEPYVPAASAPAESTGDDRPADVPTGSPSSGWTRAELDAYARWALGADYDPADYATKGDLVNYLNASTGE